MTRIKVPLTPDGVSGWRKTVTSLDEDKVGGNAVVGAWLAAGDEAEIPTGTLIVAVDNRTTGWEVGYRTYQQYPVQDATVTVHQVTDAGLVELWSRHYKTAKAAFGLTTRKAVTVLLAAHPAPTGEIVVVHEARRPNRREDRCRHCRRTIGEGLGHVVGHGQDAAVEHYQDCPPQQLASWDTGVACALCGVEVVWTQAKRHVLRDGSGDTQVRHNRVDGKTCLEQPISSPAEQKAARDAQHQAELERMAAEAAERKAKEAAKAAREETKKAQADAAHDAEQARVAALKVIGESAKTLFDKGLGNGRRAQLVEHVVRLEDDTTTTRWSVTVYTGGNGFNGEDYDPDLGDSKEFTRKPLARAHYQSLHFEPYTPPRRTSRGRQPLGGCDNCQHDTAYHRRTDSSGIAGVVCDSCHKDENYMLSFG